MITFIIKDHTERTGIQVVELHENGELIGTIAAQEQAIRVTSKYFSGVGEIPDLMAILHFQGNSRYPRPPQT